MKVCIDAGHGGRDPGATGIAGRHEKDDTLRMALALQKLFEAGGQSVIMTRAGDEYPTLKERVTLANKNKADLFLSLHRNAFTNAKAEGIEVLLSTKASEKSKLVAESIQKRLIAVGGRDRGVKVQAKNVYVLDQTSMPACTVELGFVTNSGDNERFDRCFDAYMQAVAHGVYAAYDCNASANPPTSPQPAENPLVLSRVLRITQPYMRGADVEMLQLWLGSLGYTFGQLDGIYGKQTEQAVKKLQKDRGLLTDGQVGKKTLQAMGGSWAAEPAVAFTLKRLLKQTKPLQRGEDVRAVQQLLQGKGITPGKIDGLYGQRTASAVKAVQKKVGLKVDGIVGEQTAVALGGAWKG